MNFTKKAKIPFIITLTVMYICFAACEGPMGPMGKQGQQGDQGQQGNQGDQGKQGDKGDTGAQGPSGDSINWRGELPAAPAAPQLFWAYFNTTTGNANIYTGTAWAILAKSGVVGESGKNGVDGFSINWRGTLFEHPDAAEIN